MATTGSAAVTSTRVGRQYRHVIDTEVMPGVWSANVPAASVRVMESAPPGDRPVTVAPTMGAPLWSRTDPTTKGACPRAGGAASMTESRAAAARVRFTDSLDFRL